MKTLVSRAILRAFEGRPEERSIPTAAFLAKESSGIRSTRQAPNRGMMGLRLLENDHSFPLYNHDQFVAGFHLQRLARLTWNYNLVFRGKSYFRPRFKY